MQLEVIIEEHIHHFLQDVKTEYNGEKEAVIIMRKYLKEGSITDDEEKILKIQVMNSLKIVGIGIPFALIPGASILMPIIIKVAGKHHIELMPSAFVEQKNPTKEV